MEFKQVASCFALIGILFAVDGVHGDCAVLLSKREPCKQNFGMISETACQAEGCCFDRYLNIPICFNPTTNTDTENSVGSAGRLTGNSLNVPNLGTTYIPTTAAVQYGGACLAHCTLVLPQQRVSCRSDGPTDMQSCISAGCCYDSSDADVRRRCYFSAATSSACPSNQCLVPSGKIQTCAQDGVEEEYCNRLGCCYAKSGSKSLCYGKEEPPTRNGQPISSQTNVNPTATGQLTFLGALRKETGGSLKEFSVLELLKYSLPELLQKRKERLEEASRTTTTTTTPAPTTTTPVPTTTRTTRATTTHPAFVYQRVCNWGRCTQRRVKPPPPRMCYPADCGRPRFFPGSPLSPNINDNKKIVGGTRAHPFSHPWMVMIIKTEGKKTFICGGSIICKNWIVTAAHCLNKQSKQSKVPDLDAIFYEIHVGRYMGEKFSHGKQVQKFKGRKDIDFLVQHENFTVGVSRGIITDDIALIRLKKPIIFDNYVQPVCMPTQRVKEGKVVFATGWGITKGRGPTEKNLKQLGVEIKNDAYCQAEVPGFTNPKGVLCAGGEANQDTCTGDSGGPLVGEVIVQSNRQGPNTPRWLLYGLTSIGSPSCNTLFLDRQPAVYTDVNYFLEWIHRKTDYCCY